MKIEARKREIKENIKEKIVNKNTFEKKMILNEIDNTSYLEAEKLNTFFNKKNNDGK